MKIYYFEKANGEKIGSLSQDKIIKMANGNRIWFCDISEFDGQLLSEEWNG